MSMPTAIHLNAQAAAHAYVVVTGDAALLRRYLADPNTEPRTRTIFESTLSQVWQMRMDAWRDWTRAIVSLIRSDVLAATQLINETTDRLYAIERGDFLAAGVREMELDMEMDAEEEIMSEQAPASYVVAELSVELGGWLS